MKQEDVANSNEFYLCWIDAGDPQLLPPQI